MIVSIIYIITPVPTNIVIFLIIARVDIDLYKQTKTKNIIDCSIINNNDNNNNHADNINKNNNNQNFEKIK